MNIFLTHTFDQRLRFWYDLRNSLQDADLEKICVEVDKFWQQTPLVNHYLHPADIENWPNPWELIHNNNYCYYARALGVIYTLLLLGIKEVDLCTAKDYNNVDVVLVIAGCVKYVMNYWPDSVVNTNLTEFTHTKRINIEPLLEKIG
jgi:hypothetical protein